MKESMIDYITYNVSEIPKFLELIDVKESFMKNYKYMYTSESGETVHYGNVMTDKYHVIATGTACRHMQYEFGIKGMCEIIASCKNINVTRLDLAITQFIDENGIITPRDVRSWYIAGLIECKHVKHGSSWYESDMPNYRDEKITTGETFYVGDWSRRAKHGIFRAYDKGLDIGLEQYLITRLEVEEKRKDAQLSFNRLLKSGSVEEVFKSRFDVKDRRFQELLSCKAIDITRGKSKKQLDEEEEQLRHFSRWSWLVDQVAPSIGRALARDMTTNTGMENYEVFTDAIYKHYKSEIERLRESQ